MEFKEFKMIQQEYVKEMLKEHTVLFTTDVDREMSQFLRRENE